jgi:small subunit ribosomal protein S6
LNKYEIMFLFDPTFAAEGEKVREEIERILGRAEAKITFLEKWDERRLAYEIEGRRRGTYFLVYFDCAGDKITGIERDARLSETVLRILVKRADNITPAVIERFMPTTRAAVSDSKPAESAGKRAAPASDDSATSDEGTEESASADEESSAVAVAESDAE